MLPTHLFQRIPSCTSEELRDRIRTTPSGQLMLLDVREPVEYEDSHIPGAVHIPLGQLPQRIQELEDRPTVVYCRSGNRSAAATSLLLRAGRDDVTNLDGGLLAWNGVAVTGLPEIHMPYPAPEATFPEIVAVTWSLEHSTEQWYIRLASRWHTHSRAGDLFQQLAQEEERHQVTLATTAANSGLSSTELSDLRGSLGLAEGGPEATIEGGIRLEKALQWASHAKLLQVLELATAIEAIAFDRYAGLARTASAPARSLFHRLSTAEHHHFLRVAEALEEAGAHAH